MVAQRRWLPYQAVIPTEAEIKEIKEFRDKAHDRDF